MTAHPLDELRLSLIKVRALYGSDSAGLDWNARHRGAISYPSALEPWLADRVELPVGPLFCVIDGPTRGRAWSASAARIELHHLALKAGVRRRFAPHQLRHAHAVEMAREGVPLVVIQRQLGHANLGITSVYLQGIDNAEIIDTIRARPAPVIPASAGLGTPR